MHISTSTLLIRRVLHAQSTKHPQSQRQHTLVVRKLKASTDLVVADVRVESSDQHETVLHEMGDALCVSLNANDAVVSEAPAAVAYEPH
jgi:uncharacterized membrane-anchored protein